MEPATTSDITAIIKQQVERMAIRQNAAITANLIAISKNNIASKLRFILVGLINTSIHQI